MGHITLLRANYSQQAAQVLQDFIIFAGESNKANKANKAHNAHNAHKPYKPHKPHKPHKPYLKFLDSRRKTKKKSWPAMKPKMASMR